MFANRVGLLCALMSLTVFTAAQGQQPAPQLDALQQLGQQNLSSLTSHPRMGGPSGISVHELPAAAARRQARQVDAIHAIREGSNAPLPQIELAHPSHVVGVPGSRPFVSHGPISRSPGTRRRYVPDYLPGYGPQMTTQPASTPTAGTAPSGPVWGGVSTNGTVQQPAPIFTSTSAASQLFPGAGGPL